MSNASPLTPYRQWHILVVHFRRRSHLIERILLVAGESNAGKSHQLRDMFRDQRLGGRPLPPQGRPRAYYEITTGRYAHMRISSPHETQGTLDDYWSRVEKATTARFPDVNWLVAFSTRIREQGRGTQYVPALDEVIPAVQRRLDPECIIVVALSPDYLGREIGGMLMQRVEALPTHEVVYRDAGYDQGLYLASLLLD